MPRVYRTGDPLRRAARAVADAARLLASLDDVSAVVAEAIQKQACSIAEIGLELETAAAMTAPAARRPRGRPGRGCAPSPRIRFRERVRSRSLPTPQYNVFLRATDGTDIGEVDAWWADAGVSVEIDSQEYHFYRADWLRTEAKRSRLLKHGVFPHNIAPVRVDNDWEAVCAELDHRWKRAASARASLSSPSTPP